MTACPVCNSTDRRCGIVGGTYVEVCGGCGRVLAAQTLASKIPPPILSADEMVAAAEAIVRGRA